MAVVGTGTTITFATGFCAEILNVSHDGISRKAIDTTHMGTTGGMTFTPGALYDPGGLRVSLAFAPGANPPIDQAVETITVTFPDGETESFDGFLTDFAWTDPLEDRMTADATIKATGDITSAP